MYGFMELRQFIYIVRSPLQLAWSLSIRNLFVFKSGNSFFYIVAARDYAGEAYFIALISGGLGVRISAIQKNITKTKNQIDSRRKFMAPDGSVY